MNLICILLSLLVMPGRLFHASEPKSKQGALIGKKLTPTNALFPRKYAKKEEYTESEAQNIPYEEYSARSVLIFLDEDEYQTNRTGPITVALAAAILQKPCPLIISGSLLANIFRPSNIEGDYEDIKEKLLKLAKLGYPDLGFLSKRKDLPEKDDYYLKFIPRSTQDIFDTAEWLIYDMLPKQSGLLFLLIPRSYLTAKDQSWEKIFEQTNKFELFLGLHIDKMSQITVSKDQLCDGYKKNYSGNAKSYSENAFSEKLITAQNSTQTLFVSRNTYRNESMASPEWVVYLTGHGGTGYIASLTIAQFKNLLAVLQSTIVTKLFMYDSCHAGGANQAKAYEQELSRTRFEESFLTTLKSGFPRAATYPFPIIAVGTTEASTRFSLYKTKQKHPSDTFMLDIPIWWTDFVKAAETKGPVAYQQLLAHNIDNFLVLQSQEDLNISNYEQAKAISNAPVIRPPNSTYFLPVIPTIEITELFALTRDPDKPLDLKKYLQQSVAQQFNTTVAAAQNKYVSMVILHAQYIPFEIKLILKDTTSSAPFNLFILSSFTRKTSHPVHIFESIATDQAFDPETPSAGFFAIFSHVSYKETKTFFIKKLIVNPGSQQEEYNNVSISIGHQNSVFYQHQNKTYFATLGKKATENPTDYLSSGIHERKQIEMEYTEQRKKITGIKEAREQGPKGQAEEMARARDIAEQQEALKQFSRDLLILTAGQRAKT